MSGQPVLVEPLTIQANIEHGWWKYLFQPIDMVLASPPCQPWSRAGSEQGLESIDGRLIVMTIVQCVLLRPAVLCMEEVSAILSHRHFAWIREFLQWGGFELVWCQALNLSEILPQSRNRLLLVAVRKDDPRVEQLAAVSWTRSQHKRTLKNILLPSSHMSHAFAPCIEPKVLEKYFRCTYLPPRVGTTLHEIRRCRIHSSDDIHPCIMANYAFAHELPEPTLREGGLLGSFVMTQGRIRWLSPVELAMLFGVGSKCHMPMNPKIANHMIGNAIAVPHAILGILDGIAQFQCVTWTEVPLWILNEALGSRITASNVQVVEDRATQTIIVERGEVSPTLSWEDKVNPLYCLRITCDNQAFGLQIAPNVSVWEVLRSLFKMPTNANPIWQPRGDAEVFVPLCVTDTVPPDGMHLKNMWTGPMILDERSFTSSTHNLIIALSPRGIFVTHRDNAETVDDLLQHVQSMFHTPVRCENHLGRVFELADTPPSMCFVRSDIRQGTPCLDQLLTCQWSVVPEGLFGILTMHEALSLLQLYCELGLTDLIRSLGWKTILDASIDTSGIKGTSVKLGIVRCAHMTQVPIQDLQNVLATRLVLAFIQRDLQGIQQGYNVRLKLWHSYIWTGLVQGATPSGFFAHAWQKASKHLGHESCLRTIIKGQRANPEWPFSEYLDSAQEGHSPVNIHMIMELHGGGSKAEAALKTKEDFIAKALQAGLDPVDVRHFASQLYLEAGAARVRSLVNISDETAFLQQVEILAKQTRVQMPQVHDLEADRHKRIKTTWQNRKMQNHTPADQLQIEPGTFCRHDGTEVKMSEQQDTPGEGVTFVEPDMIASMVHENKTKHEVMMLVVPGPSCPLEDATCQRFNIPVRLSDRSKVVIAACCHSIGRQAVTVKLSEGDSASVTASVKTMFVAWRCECTDATWNSIMEAPIQTVFKLLGVTPAEAIAGPPSGRSWRAHRQSVEPRDAESFCFYARVTDLMLTSVLQRSGQSGVYTIPKSEHSNLADSRYSIVWVPMGKHQEVLERASNIECSLGIVRSSKERPTYGIRVKAADFESVWQKVRPSDPKPVQIQGDFLYKISPLPVGVTYDDVSKWIAMQKLQARPMRALNATTWLLIGTSDLQKTHLTWQHNAILLQPIESKYHKAKPVILAGRRTNEGPRRTWRSDPKNESDIDPLMVNDPWATAVSSRRHFDWPDLVPRLETPSSSSSRTTASSMSSEQQTKQQKDIENMQTRLNSLEQAITSQKKETSNLRKEVHTDLQQVRKEVADRITEVKDDFHTSLNEALGKTQAALRSSFKEDFDQLKLLLTATGRKRPSNGDDNMEED